MRYGLTLLIHKKIHHIFRDVGGKIKNDSRKELLKKIEERPSKLEKGYSQDLVKQTVVCMLG